MVPVPGRRQVASHRILSMTYLDDFNDELKLIPDFIGRRKIFKWGHFQFITVYFHANFQSFQS